MRLWGGRSINPERPAMAAYLCIGIKSQYFDSTTSWIISSEYAEPSMILAGAVAVSKQLWHVQRYFTRFCLRTSYFLGITVNCSESSVIPESLITLPQLVQLGSGFMEMTTSFTGMFGYLSLGFLIRLLGGAGFFSLSGFLYLSELAPYKSFC